FIGIGGVLSSSGYTGTPAQRAAAFEADLEAAGAIGFFVADASLDLGVVGNGTLSWIGVAAHVPSMGVTGLPEGFALKIKDLDLLYNIAPASDRKSTRLNSSHEW